MKTKYIKIPFVGKDETCEECPCKTRTEAKNEKVYYLCRAFNSVLMIGVDGYGTAKATFRCDECLKSEVADDE